MPQIRKRKDFLAEMASNQANLKNARKQLDAEMAMQHATQSALDASVASGQRGALAAWRDS